MPILRVQSAEGTKRIECDTNDSLSKLFEKVCETFELSSFDFQLFKDRNQKEEIISSNSKYIFECYLKHGDTLFLCNVNRSMMYDQPSTSSQTYPVKPQTSRSEGEFLPSVQLNTNSAQEDDVDLLLYKTDGKIIRERDEKLCHHNANGCCIHCSPLEPYDESYLNKNIKHMSFHSYLRKLTSGVDRGKFLALEDMSCRIKTGCKDHPPWPRGICSKCQPNAVTLNRQIYRHVDYVMMENSSIVERFLDYWRKTGNQRIGFLYGKYELHPDVPLGIKARVSVIYEPPQHGTKDMVTLLPDDREVAVNELAKRLGLTRVGWIYTDLLSEDVSKGTVQHVRGIESHFMSAQECIMAGHFQNQHPNACRYAPSGYFGSKFVTVCVTGSDTKEVHMEGYQVTGQCMALVRDDCLVPTKDAPELGYVRESSDKQYVPDVYYKENDQYSNEVARVARPLPVEYLLVDVPSAMPKLQEATFTRCVAPFRPFPTENRNHEPVDLHSLAVYLAQWSEEQFLEAMSDFHVLLYIATMDALPMYPHMTDLIESILTKNKDLAAKWRQSEHWATVEQLIDVSEHPSNMSSSLAEALASGIDEGPMWTCPHCTFHNPAKRDTCEICVLPRNNM